MIRPTELRTQRLLLRPFVLGDADDVLRYATSAEWAPYLGNATPQPYSARDAEEFVARSVLASWDTRPTFAIVLDGAAIGAIILAIEAEHNRAEIGYSISSEHWGKGLAPEAGLAVMGWAFQVYGLDKIYARCDARNERSWRVMEKLGMAREGQLRSHEEWRQERRDILCYGILRKEWRGGSGCAAGSS